MHGYPDVAVRCGEAAGMRRGFAFMDLEIDFRLNIAKGDEDTSLTRDEGGRDIKHKGR
ncbi:hypothetical protein F2Q69_00021774 [Brassica cretica]|uniref:Uncharacterized protein n=1 Tax=Brassica cretica TaxID=69181 RepID=A0A8S9Q321_BRACR|nr:hypothetical protein F2Q69_00021774 [Brassica cretica]